jgi:MarR family transcriptional regulator for hemolysin
MASSNAATLDRPEDAVGQPFRLGFLVHDVSRMRRTLWDQALKPLGLTRSQWWVLAHLSRHRGASMMQTELARILDVGKVTVGGLIDRLEASGHVERRADASDRRAKRVFVTARGEAVINQMAAIGTELNDIILKDLSSADIQLAEEVLHRMKENLRRTLGGEAGDFSGLK